MGPVHKYNRSYRRFTWNNRIVSGAPVLTKGRNTAKDECSYYSVIAVLESNMRLQRGFLDNLSIKYLKQKCAKVVRADPEMLKLSKVEQLMKILKEIGVPSETVYNLIIQKKKPLCPMYKIAGYKKYDVSQYNHIRAALEKHLKRGPMVAVFWISGNYDECMRCGTVYRFTGQHVRRQKEGEMSSVEERISHSMCVMSFGIEEDVPFLMFRIDVEGWPEFGRVEIHSDRTVWHQYVNELN